MATHLLLGGPDLQRQRLGFELARDGGTVVCLSAERPAARISTGTAERATTPGSAAEPEWLQGQPWALDFGLSGGSYLELCRRVTHVHWLDGSARASLSRPEAEQRNIGGAREALTFSKLCPNLDRLVLHSNVAVSGDRTGVVLESELRAKQRFSEPSSATLAIAELMAQRQSERVPTVTLRASQVVAQEEAIRSNAPDGVLLAILVCLATPQDYSSLLPRWGDHPVHVVRADYWAAASAALARDRASVGQTFHLTDPSPPSLRLILTRCIALRGTLLKEGFAMPPLTQVFRRVEPLPKAKQRSAGWLRPLDLVSLAPREVRYDTAGARAALAQRGLHCPSLASYLEPLARQVAAHFGSPPDSTRPVGG